MNSLYYDYIESPVGTVLIVCDDSAMRRLYFADRKPDAAGGATRTRDPLGYSSRLEAYFGGDLAALNDIAVQPEGTPFQQLVWNALRGIPVGQTESYGGLAARIGRPSACRAVGLANGQNPISLVIPCHRVIGSNGKLTGYGGGIERKRWLLDHEAASYRDRAIRGEAQLDLA